MTAATPKVNQLSVDPSGWWVLVVLGVLSCAIGIAALVFPGPTLLAVGLLFGAYLAVWGAGLLVSGAVDKEQSGALRALNVVLGIVALLVGIGLIIRPGQSVLTVVLLLGVWFVFVGVLQLVQAAAVRERRGFNALWGVIGVAAGVIILVNVDIGLVTLVWIVGIGLILQGVVEIAMGLALRRAGKGGQA